MNILRMNGVPRNGGGMLERDEDLVLFRELHKREKDRIATLLQPFSDEFEPNGSAGNFALYRMASGKKGSGYQFLPDNNKNDYDWLKTPPATPLFPSLEMEVNAAQPVVQRELPIIQPPSRFAGHKESKTSVNGRPKSPNPKPKNPSRSVTPSYRPSSQLVKMKAGSALNQPITNYDPLKSKRTTSSVSKHANPNTDFLTSNLSKNLATFPDNKTKPRSRGVSPLPTSTCKPVQHPGFSDERPPNLKTGGRSSSSTRGRPLVHQNACSTPRQSCSPSVSRGRRSVQEAKKETKVTQILGSKMVEKVMNARKSVSSIDQRETKPRLRGSIASATIETGGFVRTRNTSKIYVETK